MWAILTKDSTDEFNERLDFADSNSSLDLHDVEFYDNWNEAKVQYKKVKGKISNVYLVKVIKEEMNI